MGGTQRWVHHSGWEWEGGYVEKESRREQGGSHHTGAGVLGVAMEPSCPALPFPANPSHCLFCTLHPVVKAASFIQRNNIDLHPLSTT